MHLKQTAMERLGGIPSTAASISAITAISENDSNPLMKQSAYRILLNASKDGTLATKLWNMEAYNDGYRQMALSWWSQHDLNEARSRSLEAISSGYPEPTRVQAIAILGNVKDVQGSRQVFDTLAEVLKETSFGARNTAMNALASYGDKAAIPLLEPFKSNSLVFFRNTASGAIQRLGG
jgi:hypothetical protein